MLSQITKKITTANDIRTYVVREIENNDNDVPHIFLAFFEALNIDEQLAIGRIILNRNEALADKEYRHGGEMFDPWLALIAKGLNWNP